MKKLNIFGSIWFITYNYINNKTLFNTRLTKTAQREGEISFFVFKRALILIRLL